MVKMSDESNTETISLIFMFYRSAFWRYKYYLNKDPGVMLLPRFYVFQAVHFKIEKCTLHTGSKF